MSLNRYPAELPKAEAAVVLAYLRHKSGTIADVLEAAWYIQGYGMSFIPQTPTFGAAPADDGQLEAALAGIVEESQTMKAVPWALLLPLVLQLVQRLMK